MRTWNLKSEVEGGDFIGIERGWGGNHIEFMEYIILIINSLSSFPKKRNFPFYFPFPSLWVIDRSFPKRGFFFSPQLSPSITLSLKFFSPPIPFSHPLGLGAAAQRPAVRAQPRGGRTPWSRGQASRRRRGGAAGGDGAAQRATIDREGEGNHLVFVPLLVLWKILKFLWVLNSEIFLN